MAKGARFVTNLARYLRAQLRSSAPTACREMSWTRRRRAAPDDRRDMPAGHQGAHPGPPIHRAGPHGRIHRPCRASRGRGHAGQIDGECISSARRDVSKLPIAPDTPIAYITQTTLSVDDTRGVIAALRRRSPTSWGRISATSAMRPRTGRPRCGNCRDRRRAHCRGRRQQLEFQSAAGNRLGSWASELPRRRCGRDRAGMGPRRRRRRRDRRRFGPRGRRRGGRRTLMRIEPSEVSAWTVRWKP